MATIKVNSDKKGLFVIESVHSQLNQGYYLNRDETLSTDLIEANFFTLKAAQKFLSQFDDIVKKKYRIRRLTDKERCSIEWKQGIEELRMPRRLVHDFKRNIIVSIHIDTSFGINTIDHIWMESHESPGEFIVRVIAELENKLEEVRIKQSK